MSFIPKGNTTPRLRTPAFHHHRKPTPSAVSSMKKKHRAADLLLRQMYNAARFHKWKYTMYGWNKWKDLSNFQRLKEVWVRMEKSKKIASINMSLCAEVQELCGANQARFFLHDSASGMLFSQANPECEPIITTVGGKGLVGHVAQTRSVMRMRRSKVVAGQQNIPFVVTGQSEDCLWVCL